MSAISAGSAQNIQQAMYALRQTVQAEHLAAAAVTEAVNEAANQALQQNNREPAEQSVPVEQGRGERVDVKA